MPKPKSVMAYLSSLSGEEAEIAAGLRKTIEARWPRLLSKLAWGCPCWAGNERVFSIIAHKGRCNLQLWQGAQLAPDYTERIEGTGKALRHVKIYALADIDDELLEIMERAVELDAIAPKRVH